MVGWEWRGVWECSALSEKSAQVAGVLGTERVAEKSEEGGGGCRTRCGAGVLTICALVFVTAKRVRSYFGMHQTVKATHLNPRRGWWMHHIWPQKYNFYINM
jgi:hypothetical protein